MCVYVYRSYVFGDTAKSVAFPLWNALTIILKSPKKWNLRKNAKSNALCGKNHPSRKPNSLDNPTILGHHVLLARYRDTSVLQRVIRFPEEIFPVILEAFVKSSHDDNTDHRAHEAADRRDPPAVKQYRLTETSMKSHLRVGTETVCQ